MWLMNVMIDSPDTSPISAVMIGRPIATTVPNVNTRTITAMARPMTSLSCVSGLETFWPM